jgi:peptidoglycan/xylan/chitin deacetylase (PgdA/CDA1 family)
LPRPSASGAERLATSIKRAGKALLRLAPLRAAALRAATARGNGLALLYHRVTDDDAALPGDLVPSIPRRLLRRQLEVLGEVGDLVPLERLHTPAGDRRRPRFGLSFDDDYRSHGEQVLPVLRALGITGTFFLSGRSLHRLGPYWFESLERLVAERGLDQARRLLGVGAATPADLAVTCEGNPRLQRLVAAAVDLAPDHLRPAQIAQLAEAGMAVGFHTLHHRRLVDLDGDGLRLALADGREALEAAAGGKVDLLAYPHGKADGRVAAAARAAGYRMAWTGWPRPVRAGDDPFLLGRWEPGPLETDAFVAALAVRVNRAAPP